MSDNLSKRKTKFTIQLKRINYRLKISYALRDRRFPKINHKTGFTQLVPQDTGQAKPLFILSKAAIKNHRTERMYSTFEREDREIS